MGSDTVLMQLAAGAAGMSVWGGIHWRRGDLDRPPCARSPACCPGRCVGQAKCASRAAPSCHQNTNYGCKRSPARRHRCCCRWFRAFYWESSPGIEEPFRGLAYNLTLKSLLKRHRYWKARLLQPTAHCNLPVAAAAAKVPPRVVGPFFCALFLQELTTSPAPCASALWIMDQMAVRVTSHRPHVTCHSPRCALQDCPECPKPGSCPLPPQSRPCPEQPAGTGCPPAQGCPQCPPAQDCPRCPPQLLPPRCPPVPECSNGSLPAPGNIHSRGGSGGNGVASASGSSSGAGGVSASGASQLGGWPLLRMPQRQDMTLRTLAMGMLVLSLVTGMAYVALTRRARVAEAPELPSRNGKDVSS